MGWIILWIVALLVFLVLAACNFPSLDDYNYAMLMQENGLAKSQSLWYQEWSGRYFSNLVLSLNPLTFHSFTGYKILTGLLIAGFFGTLLAFTRHFFTKGSGTGNILYFSAVCSLLYILILPTFSEGFYWMASALTYQLPALFTLIFLILAHKTGKKEISKGTRSGLFILNALLVISICGSNELSMVSIIYIIAFLLLYDYLKNRKISWTSLLWLMIALICALFVLSSPGNENRSRLFTVSMTLPEVSLKAGWNMVSFFGRSLPPLIIFGSVLAIPWFSMLKKNSEKPEKPWLYVHPLISAVMVIMLIYGQYWVGWYSTKAPLIARTENICVFTLLTGSLWISSNGLYLLRSKNIFLSEKAAKILFGLALLCSTYFFARENNLRSGLGDLALNRAFTYERQMSERQSMLEQCTSDTCTIPTLEVRPVLLYIGSFQDPAMPQQYRSWCSYFGKKMIIESPREQDRTEH